jgi:chemotaxis protein CheY-P-specific phosphatase CheC
MQNNMNDIIEEIFCDVLEKLAFMFGEPAILKELSFVSSKYSKVTMKFTGNIDGEITLIVPDEMTQELAMNILGLDFGDTIEEEQAADSLKELLNVICGQFLTEYAGEKPVFDLGIPEISTLDKKNCEILCNEDNTVGFLVDNYSVLFGVKIKK